MSKTSHRRAEGNAGAFLGTDAISMTAVPMRTLSDEYHDAPEPEPPGADAGPGLRSRVPSRRAAPARIA